MRKILINYAHNGFYASQEKNAKTGLEIGGFTDVIKYNFKNLDDKFVFKNQNILMQPRGAGYWLWKPYIILKTLEAMDENDILFYSDAAIEFSENMKYYFDLVCEQERGIVLFYNNSHLNHTWTKRDCFILMGLDKMFTDSTPCAPYDRQLTASLQLCRKTDFTINLYREYLKFSEDARILTDMPNTLGLPNYEGFREHRHDQSIISLLRHKYDIFSKEDICQWGWAFRPKNEKQIINHHRRKN
jgi:hypothetical protein